MIFEHGKIKGLKGCVIIVKDQDKIKATYPFLCEKMELDFGINYVASIWGKPDSIKNIGSVNVNKVAFEDLDVGYMNPFAKKVYQKLYATKNGSLLSYGELAAKAGKPTAARAVGTLMRKNSFPLIVPCHRVYAKSGAEHFSITCFNKRPTSCTNKTQKSLCECAKKIKLSLRDIENE